MAARETEKPNEKGVEKSKRMWKGRQVNDKKTPQHK